MQVEVAETGPCSRSLQITITPEQVQEHLDQLYASAADQVQIKGFRKGKVPRKMIEKLHGEAILSEAKEQLLNRYFGEACREQEIQPIGRVKIDDFEQVEVTIGQGLAFTARVDVKPEIRLPELKGIEIPAYENEANDADIDNALKEIAHQKRKIGPVEAEIEAGDFVRCDYSFADEDGNEVHARTGVQLNTNIPIHGVDQAAYSEALIGGKSGDAREMPIAFPDNFEKEAVRGKNGTVKVTIHEVLRVSPAPIDDELAKGMEFDSLELLRDDLRTRITGEKQRLGKQNQEEAALQHLLTAAAVPAPPSMVEEQAEASLNNFGQRLQQEGLGEEEIRKRLEDSRSEAQQDAERRVQLFFLIEAIAQQEEMTVEDADMQQELENIAAANSNEQQQITAAQVRYQHLEGENRLGELRLALLERKVRDFLRDNGKTVDKTGRLTSAPCQRPFGQRQLEPSPVGSGPDRRVRARVTRSQSP